MRDIDQYEKDYLDNPFEAELIRYRHRKTLETITSLRPRKILEVGCGQIPLHHYIDDYDQLVIVEPSKEFAGIANASDSARITVINDVLKAEYADQYGCDFDLIVISSLLHEMEDPLALLTCAANFASPKSVFHINVPNANSLHRLLAVKMGLITDVTEKSERQIKYQQSHTFDVQSLSELVRAAKLEVISCETFFIKPFTHSQMQSLLDSGFMDDRMLEGFYQLGADLPTMGAEIALNARLAG